MLNYAHCLTARDDVNAAIIVVVDIVIYRHHRRRVAAVKFPSLSYYYDRENEEGRPVLPFPTLWNPIHAVGTNWIDKHEY